MSLLVDTSVWSLAFRRDRGATEPEVAFLRQALESGEIVTCTGLVLQELLQGFSGPRARADLIDRFKALPFIAPDRQDHIEAAGIRNRCRRAGLQVGTIDAVLAQLCIHYALIMLTTDKDFIGIARYFPLKIWAPRQ